MTLAVVVAVFLLDVSIPPVFSAGILYVVAIWGATLHRRINPLIVTAAICSLLLILATWFQSVSAEQATGLIGSRGVILLAIWLSTGAGILFVRAFGKLAEQNLRLGSEVADKAKEVRKTMTLRK